MSPLPSACSPVLPCQSPCVPTPLPSPAAASDLQTSPRFTFSGHPLSPLRGGLCSEGPCQGERPLPTRHSVPTGPFVALGGQGPCSILEPDGLEPPGDWRLAPGARSGCPGALAPHVVKRCSSGTGARNTASIALLLLVSALVVKVRVQPGPSRSHGALFPRAGAWGEAA